MLALLFYVHFSQSGPADIRDNLATLSQWVLWLAGPALGLFFAVLSGLFKAVYGRALVVRFLLCLVNSHSAPDQPGGLWVITLSPSKRELRGLRHGLYEHEAAVPAVIDWIRRQTRPDGAEAAAASSKAGGAARER